MRLSAPLRGVVYGLALVVAVPLTWTGGQSKLAFLIGGATIFGMVLEVVGIPHR